MTLLRTLELEYDLVEIHYNALLKNKPYLVRVFNYNYNEPEELRLEQNEIDNLYKILKDRNLL
ncbi:hypothetical protein EB118_07975 [bacterium]|nr:hypothetical protein [bacterium]NDC95924.1 hypothetical protein [bacterium]NDG30016.1 hypothetical protein [bacterium]